jgi:hypothetical protein
LLQLWNICSLLKVQNPTPPQKKGKKSIQKLEKKKVKKGKKKKKKKGKNSTFKKKI